MLDLFFTAFINGITITLWCFIITLALSFVYFVLFVDQTNDDDDDSDGGTLIPVSVPTR